MAEQVNIAKRGQNMAERVDKIGSLPDAVLRHILSFLPTKIAFSTCILSTSWRCLFPFSNNLDFDDSLVFNPQGIDQSTNGQTGRFLDFVDRCIMLMNATHVDKFCVKCRYAVEASRVNSWIDAAPLQNVRELDLCIPTRELGTEPLRALSCNTLVVLKLGTGFSLNVPASVSLPCLKSLHLHSIKFLDDVSFQRLFSSCPVLEELLIVGCGMTRSSVRLLNLSSPTLKRLTLEKTKYSFSNCTIVLDAPSLVYLSDTVCARDSYMLKNLHSLSEAHIYIFNEYNYSSQIPLLELLQGIISVQSLYLSGHYAEHVMALDVLPPFNNVTSLVLTYNTVFRDSSVVIKLLHSTPNLKKLSFNGSIWGKCEDWCADVPFCISSRLKVIACTMFYKLGICIEKDMESLEYLMKNASVLEKMFLRLGCTRFVEEIIEKIEKMMERVKKPAMLQGQSKTCNVKISYREPLHGYKRQFVCLKYE